MAFVMGWRVSVELGVSFLKKILNTSGRARDVDVSTHPAHRRDTYSSEPSLTHTQTRGGGGPCITILTHIHSHTESWLLALSSRISGKFLRQGMLLRSLHRAAFPAATTYVWVCECMCVCVFQTMPCIMHRARSSNNITSQCEGVFFCLFSELIS